MNNPIAIVGMACQYPDASSPGELWANALAGRRAFRRMPSVRMNTEDYLNTDRNAPDSTYVLQAAVIDGYEFDRVAFRVAGGTFRSADLAHWLALDVAARALTDAGFANAEGLPVETTGVVLGNTLTGEFSRANQLRLRWPYVRRVLEQELIDNGWEPERRAAFLATMETRYKAPFPPIGEETLAGGLANTIAGRICNYFDLKGGGFTVDGACASSLLAVANACSALRAGDLDVALAGGVDLSLDPFELIGFAKTGALAPEKMRVYDARSAGFWPGEGCGFVVLMRLDEALAQGRRVFATIPGWGISSDGHGGITRPEVGGQILALRRAYARAGFGIDTVAYFEGHGTGTNVGDATELATISKARREANPDAPPAVIGSVKAIIGHTKAAAGMAGLIKATMALNAQIIPPTIGNETPHPELTGESPALRVTASGSIWPANLPLRAAVSAMGFGGINSHVVLESLADERRTALNVRERTLLRSVQCAELFLLSDAGAAPLRAKAARLAVSARDLSLAELSDLADALAHELIDGEVRAAIVAATPTELAERLERLNEWLDEGITSRLDATRGVFLGTGRREPRIAFLFPGQGSPAHLDGGILRRRFDSVRSLYDRARLPSAGDGISTDVAQPAIATASRAGLELLERFGVTAEIAVGHSLGELVALHWAGAYDGETLMRIARARGRAMADLGAPTGAMASIAAPADEVTALIGSDPVVIAGLNSPRQTVISGEGTGVTSVVERARAQGLHATMLPVSHAFHSPLVAAAAEPLAASLAGERIDPLERAVVSTITGARLEPSVDVSELLCRQMTSPVRFIEAATAALRNVDLAIEVGPGSVLTGLVGATIDVPVLAIDAGGVSVRGLFSALGAAHALGVPLSARELFADRYTRPIDLDRERTFFVNPCELAPNPDRSAHGAQVVHGEDGAVPHANGHVGAPTPDGAVPAAEPVAVPGESVIDLVRRLVAERAELPPSAVTGDMRLLGDLHLNSITISQIVIEAAKTMGLPAPAAPTEFAGSTVEEVAEALELLLATRGEMVNEPQDRYPAGVESWVCSFVPRLVPAPDRPSASNDSASGSWEVFGVDGDPFVAELRAALGTVATGTPGGVVCCVPASPDASVVATLLESVRAMNAARANRYVLVGHGGGAAAFAKTLHLERPSVSVLVVDVPSTHPEAAAWVAAEMSAVEGYREVWFDREGARRTPEWERVVLPDAQEGRSPLGADDLLLVTGGGKGIAAESGLAIARDGGAWLLLMGRSAPEDDAELTENLERLRSAGVRFAYVRADVTDRDAVRAAIRSGEEQLGRTVTAFLHGAGANVPQLIDGLDIAAFERTLRPKVEGARNVLDAIDPERLRLFVTFGSIIGRAGLRGEADYAVANEWLSRMTEEWGAAHPHCRCLAIEWSIWSGVGMGERLGRVEALIREGIHPITPEAGIDMLRRLLAADPGAVSVVVTSRFGALPTARMTQRELPLYRFIEEPLVHYPGLELVVGAELSLDNDPYLRDHAFRGQYLFPAVMGLEAFTQVASALTGAAPASMAFSEIRFERPIVVPERGTAAIRLAAVLKDSGAIEMSLRCEETSYQLDHFRLTCHVNPELETIAPAPEPPERLPLDVGAVMYRDIMFHRGRFRRVRSYRLLRAVECIAELSVDGTAGWFGPYLPATFLLGDAGVRDASIHGIQGCIPHMTLLPVSVERITVRRRPTGSVVFMHAIERLHEGRNFLYDIELRDEAGELCERWDGLLLRAVERNRHHDAWGPVLLAPYLERRMEELLPGVSLTVSVSADADASRAERRAEALSGATSHVVLHRADGKPVTNGHEGVSVSHADGLTLAIAGPGALGCDLQPVAAHSDDMWKDLLGPDRGDLAAVVARETGEDYDSAATRVWAAAESLKKSGTLAHAPLVLGAREQDGWVMLKADGMMIGTYADRDAAGPDAHAIVVALAVQMTGTADAHAGLAADTNGNGVHHPTPAALAPETAGGAS